MDNNYTQIMKHFTISRAKLEPKLSDTYPVAKLIDELNTQFCQLYQQDGGNWERYTIGQHTQMVLQQFNRYYRHQRLPGAISSQLFRLFLVLHDIGKPIAIAFDPAGKTRQHYYTWKLMSKFYQHLKIEQMFVDISHALLHDDLLGAYLRNRRTKKATEKLIEKHAMSTVLSTKEYFELLQIYYKVDAGSYTEDAGGKRSLDALFDFNHKIPRLQFAPETQKKIDLLLI